MDINGYINRQLDKAKDAEERIQEQLQVIKELAELEEEQNNGTITISNNN